MGFLRWRGLSACSAPGAACCPAPAQSPAEKPKLACATRFPTGLTLGVTRVTPFRARATRFRVCETSFRARATWCRRRNTSLRISGYQVLVDRSWDGLGDYVGSIQLEVDRNDGKGFVLLTIDTTPGYTDTQPLPVALTKWTYKAVYRVGDGQFGLWSATASVNVGG